MVPKEPFYRAASDQLCQGDIFERVPLLYAAAAPLALREVTVEGRRLLEASPLSESASSENPNTLQVAATVDFTRAILLTYDCEIDKPATKYLTLALVRPLDPSMPKQSQQDHPRKSQAVDVLFAFGRATPRESR